MNIRTINVAEVKKLVEAGCLKANYKIRDDVNLLISRALREETEPAAKMVLEHLIANHKVAAEKNMPLCQDCGYITVFVELGQDISLIGGNLYEAIQQGVSSAYGHHGLRQSVIADALLERENFQSAAMASIYTNLTPGGALKITIMPKGGGSDNASYLRMMKPTASEEEIVELIVSTVKNKGITACPPLFIGIGIGGSFDSVAMLAKKALLRRFDQDNTDKVLAKFEQSLLKKINELHLGPGGLGGKSTALGVSVITAPTHMACLPVAINMGCNCLRSVEIKI